MLILEIDAKIGRSNLICLTTSADWSEWKLIGSCNHYCWKNKISHYPIVVKLWSWELRNHRSVRYWTMNHCQLSTRNRSIVNKTILHCQMSNVISELVNCQDDFFHSWETSVKWFWSTKFPAESAVVSYLRHLLLFFKDILRCFTT